MNKREVREVWPQTAHRTSIRICAQVRYRIRMDVENKLWHQVSRRFANVTNIIIRELSTHD